MRETGPQLTSLSLEIMGTGMAGTGIAASWLPNLSGLRELTMKEFAGSIIDTINLSSMTVSAFVMSISRLWEPAPTPAGCPIQAVLSCWWGGEQSGQLAVTAWMVTLQALTALELNFEGCYSPNVAVTIHSDFAFLASAQSLRVLTLEGLNGVNDQLLAAVLRISKLERLHIKGLHEWKWSAATIGRLIARAAAERPGLHIQVDEPLDYEEY